MHYKVEVLVESDRSETNVARFFEGLVARLPDIEVTGLAVYPVTV